jgi:hypothetical protein
VSLIDLLPTDSSGWHLTGAPQLFIGDELFKMIDGGAALYQEYGFDPAVSAHYQDTAGRTVDAEIYAMTDVAAAAGIFGITAAAGEQVLPLGDEGELGEYFLVFRKGTCVVTVSGQNSEKPTMEGVRLLGGGIESRLGPGSKAPQLVREFTPLVEQGSRPVYLRGAIAAGNFYMFAPQNVFSIREGVTGERDSTRFFVFRYASMEQSASNFHLAAEVLRTNAKYSRFESGSKRFTTTDRDGNLLRVSTVGNAIVVVIGRNEDANRKMEEEVSAVVTKL